MSDDKPLLIDQYLNLMNVWIALNCTALPQVCPHFDRDLPCPNLGMAQYGPRLVCTQGYVTQITLDDTSGVTGGFLSGDIGRLSRLTELKIHDHYRGLSTTLPTTLGLLTDLEVFNFCCNDIFGTLPTQLGKMSNLRQLGFHGNRLSGSIPTELAAISSLTYVRFYSNQLSGVAPRFVAIPTVAKATFTDDCELVRGVGDQEMNCFSDCEIRRCCEFCCGDRKCFGASSTTMMPTQTITTNNSSMTMTTTNTTMTTSALTTIDASAFVDFSFQQQSNSFPLSAVVGGVVGGILFLLFIAMIVFLVIRRRRNEPQATTAPIATTTTPPINEYGSVAISQNNYDVGNLNTLKN